MYVDTDSTPSVVLDASSIEELVHPFGATLVEERPQSTTIVIESPKPPSSPVIAEKVATPVPQELKVPTPQPQERKKSGKETIWSTSNRGSLTDKRPSSMLTILSCHPPPPS